MKRIFVPTDFSSPSLPSYKFAVELAAEINGEVFVTHMIELPLLQETTFGIQPPPHDADAINRLEKKAYTAYEHFSRAYPANVPVTFTPIQGHIVQEAVAFIEANHIDVVVISTHGASALDDFFTGSTAGKIARSSPVPVISIPRNIPLNAIKNLVFANTLELDQHELMRYVRELQQILKATLHILLVNTPSHFYSDDQAREKLKRFAEFYALTNYTLNSRSHQHETTAIMSFFNEVKGDMLALATHGRKGVPYLIKGSIAESLLYGIDHPVWTWKIKSK